MPSNETSGHNEGITVGSYQWSSHTIFYQRTWCSSGRRTDSPVPFLYGNVKQVSISAGILLAHFDFYKGT